MPATLPVAQASPAGKIARSLPPFGRSGHAGVRHQFGSGFVDANPNSKIPALVDHGGAVPIRVFESGSILLYLAEKFNAFIPTDAGKRAEVVSWLFWQMGAGPMLGGGFGHFYAYAPVKIEYAIDRFAMEVKRQLDVLDRRLAESEYVGGGEYSIADMAVWPWYGALVNGLVYEASEFLQVKDYKNVLRWTDMISARPAVMRGRQSPTECAIEIADALDLPRSTKLPVA